MSLYFRQVRNFGLGLRQVQGRRQPLHLRDAGRLEDAELASKGRGHRLQGQQLPPGQQHDPRKASNLLPERVSVSTKA